MSLKNSKYIFQSFFCFFGTWLYWFLGGWDGLLYSLVAFIAVDYVSRALLGVLERNLNSEMGYRCILRKLYIIMLVGVANILDVYILGNGGLIRTATILFFVSNEGLSILENASRAGLPVPVKVSDVLSKFKQMETVNKIK